MNRFQSICVGAVIVLFAAVLIGAGTAKNATQPAPARWEYQIYQMSPGQAMLLLSDALKDPIAAIAKGNQVIVKDLNALGNDGWELVSADYKNGCYVLKRRAN
jgi:hypothetical protein